MSRVNIEIDGETVSAEEGEVLLWAALDAGYYIPHLCAAKEIDHHPAACRLCFVEVEGIDRPVTACTQTVQQGMKVKTRSERVDRLVRTGFELLMSTHRLDCKVCPANRKCGLQEVAKKRKVPLKPKQFDKIEPDYPVDESREDFGMNPNHCILCGKCVHVCENVKGCRVLDFSQRGLRTVLSTFNGKPLAEQDACDGCLKCVRVCPVGALYLKEDQEAKKSA